MKKSLFTLVALLFTFSTAQAQQYEDAKKAYNTFTLDAFNNKPKLHEAKNLIDAAMRLPENQSIPDAWLTKGKIYTEIASQVIQIKSTNLGRLEDLPPADAPALEAYLAYAKALPLVTKKFETKDALTGLQAVQGNLDNFGRFAFEDQNYQLAYDNFNFLIKSHEDLKRHNTKSILDSEESLNYAIFLTATAAQLAGNNEAARSLLEQLYRVRYDKAAIYESLYTLHAENDINAAYVYLKEGRERYPDETSLLFVDINHHLKTGQIDPLIGKLKTAIEKEPNNVSLYITLGRVYDDLQQRERAAQNTEQALEYFQLALENYTEAARIDPASLDAHYQLGLVYYNQAALITKELNESGNTDQERYQEVMGLFDQALPNFQKAESLDANDLNTLTALAEIYTRKEDALAEEFQKRLNRVKNGGKNTTSYFR